MSGLIAGGWRADCESTKEILTTVVPMSIMTPILMRMFGRPRGSLGRLGGQIMARLNAECGVRACELLEIAADDAILEIGFGPGVTIDHVATLVPAGRVAGIDPSPEMVAQASARNAAAIRSGRVDLRHGSVDSLPFDDNSFDGALAINSMQVWPDAVAGLREIRRVLRPGATIALGFTPWSGQNSDAVTDTLLIAGFAEVQAVEIDAGFCTLATKL
jgi:ubiquinone/menaquinone biosynthesis C-methylase UbiE